MSKRNDGLEYEKLVHYIYNSLSGEHPGTEVRHNVMLDGPDGNRQIDVLVKHIHANIKYITVIECRDYRGRINVTHVDAFASKISDVRANKGVLVARKGFSKTAVQKAKRLGIELCTVDIAPQLLKQMVVEVPVVIELIEFTSHLIFAGRNASEKTVTIPKSNTTVINDVPIRSLVVEGFRQEKIEIPPETKTMRWRPENLSPPYFMRDVNGDKFELDSFEIKLEVTPKFLFGYTSDLPDFIAHIQEGNPEARIIMPRKARVGLNSSFSSFKNRADLPSTADHAVKGMIIPDVEKSGNISTGWVSLPSAPWDGDV